MTGSRRELFSLPDGRHYLNCAYMAPLSKRVEAAGIAGLRRKRDPTTIGPPDFFAGPEQVRERFARLIGASDPRRVAVIPSASYGLAVAARNVRVSGGQNIVIVEDQFPSNVYIWRRIGREASAELRTVAAPATESRMADWNAAIREAIDDSTAVVALAQVHWTDGAAFDLKTIGDRAREVGAALILDGTQSIGAMPFDLEKVRPDAIICAGYKWLMGPYSIGVGYYGERFDDGIPLEETWIARVGSEDFRGLVAYQDAYRPGAVRYDVGESSNFILTPMLAAALEQILEWGVDEITRHCRALLAPVEAEARERGWTVADAADRGPHILGVRLPPKADLDRLRSTLAERKVTASLRGESLRVSPHVYNDRQDIEALLDALRAGL